MSNQSGFSLLQVIFASTVLGALSLQGLKMMKEQEKLAKITTQRFEIKYIQDEITEVLKNAKSCTKTFEGLTESTIPKISAISQVFHDPKTNQESLLPLYQTFESSQRLYGQNFLKIHEYKLSLPAPGQLSLEIVFDRMESGQYNRFLIREIPLSVSFNSQGKLSHCSLRATSYIEDDWGISTKVRDSHQVAIEPLKAQNIQIGHRSYNASVSVDSLLRASYNKSALPTCQQEISGTLFYHEATDRPYFCHHQDWVDLSGMEFSQLKFQDISLSSLQDEQSYVEAKLCALTMINTQSGQSKCELTPNIDQVTLEMQRRPWSLYLRKIPEDDQLTCQFRCYL